MKQITLRQLEQPRLFRSIVSFSIPLMLTGLLQLAYNTADSVVVGRYASAASLAAIGSTTSIIFLLVTLFNGVSVGANYLTARHYGAQNPEAVSQTVHCSAVLSVILGLLAGAVGFFFSTPLLELAGAPADVLPLSSLYLKIYFPVSWVLTLVIHIIFLLIYKRQLEAPRKGGNACAPSV